MMQEHFSPSFLSPTAAALLDRPEMRLDGQLKTTGGARYVNDVHLPGMLWADFLMSPYPHARIVSIDTSAAKAVPGIHAVLTGRDIGLKLYGRSLIDWPILAYDRVRYVGERVAAVAGETREAVDQAINLIQVDWEELPAVFDAEAAVLPDAPILHPDSLTYLSGSSRRRPAPHLNMMSYSSAKKGEEDIEKIFAQAYKVVEDVYEGPRQHQGYLEPHGCVVWFDEQGRLQVISTNKTPFGLREQLSKATDIPWEQIVVDVRFIGGDFGGKGHSIEEFPCVFLARATGRPIKAIMTYADELGAMDPQHYAKYILRTAVTREGKIIAHESHAPQAGGAYGASRPNGQDSASGGMGCLDVYNIPNTKLDSYMAYTNLVPAGNMRAPGAFHRGHAGEAHIDHLAREIGMDPIEFRLQNCLREGDTTITGGHLSRPRAAEVLERLREVTNWGNVQLPPNRGRGVALRDRHVGAGRAEIVFTLQPDGNIEALYGTPDQGGGSHTVLQRVAAAELGVELERVRLRFGTTAEVTYDAGSGGSRTTTMVGRAALNGAHNLKGQLEELAAEVMGWPAGQVRIEDDQFVVGDGTGERRSFTEVASRIAAGPAVSAIGAYDPAEDHHGDDIGDLNFYAYMVEVEVDRDTGQVTTTDVLAVVDVGTVINPIAHQGQLDGGFVYGFGQTMTEELTHDEGKIRELSLGEYKLPTQMDTPPFRTILLDRDPGPGAFGAKAAGETTNTGIGGAIANAIYDAVGVQIMTNPISAERVREALAAIG